MKRALVAVAVLVSLLPATVAYAADALADRPNDVEIRTQEGAVLLGQADGIDVTGLEVVRRGPAVVTIATHAKADRGQIDHVIVSYDTTSNGVPDYELRVNYLAVSLRVLGMGTGGGQWFGGYIPVGDCKPSIRFRPVVGKVAVRMPLRCLGDPSSVRVSYLAQDVRRNYAYAQDAAPGMYRMTAPLLVD